MNAAFQKKLISETSYMLYDWHDSSKPTSLQRMDDLLSPHDRQDHEFALLLNLALLAKRLRDDTFWNTPEGKTLNSAFQVNADYIKDYATNRKLEPDVVTLTALGHKETSDGKAVDGWTRKIEASYENQTGESKKLSVAVAEECRKLMEAIKLFYSATVMELRSLHVTHAAGYHFPTDSFLTAVEKLGQVIATADRFRNEITGLLQYSGPAIQRLKEMNKGATELSSNDRQLIGWAKDCFGICEVRAKEAANTAIRLMLDVYFVEYSLALGFLAHNPRIKLWLGKLEIKLRSQLNRALCATFAETFTKDGAPVSRPVAAVPSNDRRIVPGPVNPESQRARTATPIESPAIQSLRKNVATLSFKLGATLHSERDSMFEIYKNSHNDKEAARVFKQDYPDFPSTASALEGYDSKHALWKNEKIRGAYNAWKAACGALEHAQTEARRTV